jgi:plasmid stability protein
MPNLLIRNVEPALHARLKARAAAHHRSLEEEVRVLLRRGVARSDKSAPKESLVAMAQRLFGPENGIDLELPPRDWREDRPPPDFGPESE